MFQNIDRNELNPQGLGFNLYIINMLCDKMNIKISAKSEIDKGSKFTIEISAEYE